ncbi:DUF3027 domain-containing protein [Nocardia sp. GCM10030253]|uniref:DUF3027 domain-containing protein n=1 Tax=Nocardia sp. GCM10030253 TaxID=3273404 RepID=UPI00363E43A3
MSAVSVSESGVWPILADAVDVARRALVELEPAGVGAHLGVTAEDDSAATHRFEATLPGYRGWQWAVVVAAAPGAAYATVSESALLPGPDALVAPDFVPWDQRVRPGDLAPGDLLAPVPNDPRLVPGYVASGDPAVDEVAREIGLGRTQVLSLEGREEAAERWYTEFGPDTDMAKAAPSTCGLCGFYLPLAGAMRAAFGVCGNAMGADGRVVHAEYGCGAHSDTVLPTGGGSPLYEAYDDAAFDVITQEAPRKPEPESAPAGDATDTEASTEVDSSTVADDTAAADLVSTVAAESTDTVVEPAAAAPASAEADSTVGAAGDVAEPTTMVESDAVAPVSAEVEPNAEAVSDAGLTGGAVVEPSTVAGSDAAAAVSVPGDSNAEAVSTTGLPSDVVAEADRAAESSSVAPVSAADETAQPAGAGRSGDIDAEPGTVGESGAAVSLSAEGVQSPRSAAAEVAQSIDEAADNAAIGSDASQTSIGSAVSDQDSGVESALSIEQASAVDATPAAEQAPEAESVPSVDSVSTAESASTAEQALGADAGVEAAGGAGESDVDARPESESSTQG